MPKDWPEVPPLTTGRLSLEPLRTADSRGLADLLYDASLFTFMGDLPTVEQLREGYARMAAGRSPDGSQGWLNWVVRERSEGETVGWVQATLDTGESAEIAWVIASAHQGQGYGREAVAAVVEWLRHDVATRVIAHIHPDNQASMAVARAVGLAPTETVVDGEIRWQADMTGLRHG